MRFDLDNAFGIHQQALLLRSKRAEILAANLANVDTPGYSARDIDFKSAMRTTYSNLQTEHSYSDAKTNSDNHVLVNGQAVELMYRNPMQPSVDGNTVDAQVEKSQFASNAIQYQVSLQLLTGKIKSLLTAIKGE